MHRYNQRGWGEWAGGPNPPPPSMWAADALFLCGS